MVLVSKDFGRIVSKSQWEQKFSSWKSPLSSSEQEKSQNAVSVIKSAIQAHYTLSAKDLKIFLQGSNAANTNVRLDSDVDICVFQQGFFIADYPLGITAADLGHYYVDQRFPDFKNMIEESLFNRFSKTGVQRGEKSFKVAENTYRIKADVVPAWEYRKYNLYLNQTLICDTGICFYTDRGEFIINWPMHTYVNGTEKNKNTGRKYKACVRIIKKLKNELFEQGYRVPESVSSFMLESAVYNVPDEHFDNSNIYDMVTDVISHIWYSTLDLQRCNVWKEVNGIKLLFSGHEMISKIINLNGFCWNALKYIGAVNK